MSQKSQHWTFKFTKILIKQAWIFIISVATWKVQREGERKKGRKERRKGKGGRKKENKMRPSRFWQRFILTLNLLKLFSMMTWDQIHSNKNMTICNRKLSKLFLLISIIFIRVKGSKIYSCNWKHAKHFINIFKYVLFHPLEFLLTRFMSTKCYQLDYPLGFLLIGVAVNFSSWN